MRHLESNLQQSCIKAFQTFFPKRVIYAIPNGGKRNAREAARLKKEGVTAGVADLFVMEACGQHHGLYIEMKVDKGTQSISQKSFEKLAIERGYKYCICRTVEEFINTCKGYFAGM